MYIPYCKVGIIRTHNLYSKFVFEMVCVVTYNYTKQILMLQTSSEPLCLTCIIYALCFLLFTYDPEFTIYRELHLSYPALSDLNSSRSGLTFT